MSAGVVMAVGLAALVVGATSAALARTWTCRWCGHRAPLAGSQTRPWGYGRRRYSERRCDACGRWQSLGGGLQP